ncbi:MAG: DUF763 domain-containing protein [Candidatus Omnitrophica bacterium]|nr:DUF763 domain-containing protein [Candidatus Omnitrophota bacterium]
MIHRGIATFGLDTGKCPRWLFERMVALARPIIWVIVEEYGPDEFIQRIGDPVWFQSLGIVLAFDWNASGLTTILTAALKEAIRGQEKELGIFICGGKGKTSRKTPDEIMHWGEVLSLPAPKVDNLVYNSRMAAKVDSALVQDGFQIYHHAFFFCRSGAWSVVQQGMNQANQTARRYHWYSERITDLVCQPHSGIISQIKTPTLDLTAKESQHTRQVSTELARGSYAGLMKDIQILSRHFCHTSQMISLKRNNEKLTLLNLTDYDFRWHPVVEENFFESPYLKRILAKVCAIKPHNYEQLLSLEGVGPKTMRALSLVSEVIYAAKPSYQDPARYSFAFGGKDHIPYPVERRIYDAAIEFFRRIIPKAKLSYLEKNKMLVKLNQL